MWYIHVHTAASRRKVIEILHVSAPPAVSASSLPAGATATPSFMEAAVLERPRRTSARAVALNRTVTTTMWPSLSYFENLAVGSFGGCVETAILMPVITWKFCLQEGRPLPSLPGMYRGVFVLAGSVAPLTGMQMFFNGALEKMVTSGQRNATEWEAITCALGAGALSASLYAPVEMTTIQQQKLGKGPIDTIKHLTRTYGVTSLWRGLAPTAAREGIYTAGYLGIAPVITAKLMKYSPVQWEREK